MESATPLGNLSSAGNEDEKSATQLYDKNKHDLIENDTPIDAGFTPPKGPQNDMKNEDFGDHMINAFSNSPLRRAISEKDIYDGANSDASPSRRSNSGI